MPDRPIVIVGAGIIGISTAYRIAELNPGAKLTIVAKDFPNSGLLNPHYTSSKAGAHFRPFPSKNEVEWRDSELTHATYERFQQLAAEHPETSIKVMKGVDYLEYDNRLYETLSRGYTEVVKDFEVLPQPQLPKNVKFGAAYTSFSVNPHVYMNFMLDSLHMRQKIQQIRLEVHSLRQVADRFPDCIIVNCTGDGLLYDGSHDPNCFKIRGQTLLVRPPLKHLDKYENETVTYQLANGEWCFVIPRPLNGGLILGGTKNETLFQDSPIPEETESLINNARSRFPELFETETGELDVLRINVGFRPARRGGVRLEREVLDGSTIVHCYGFGGSGVEMSWGAAVKAAQLALLDTSPVSKL